MASSPGHPAADMVRRTSLVFESILLNCRSQERLWSLAPDLGSVSSWAMFCSKYEAFSSPGGPDLGKWRNCVAGRQAHSLGLGPACCSQELGPAEEGPAAGRAGSARRAQVGAARWGKQAGWKWRCVFSSAAASLRSRGTNIRGLGHVSELGCPSGSTVEDEVS